jgi:hypothetical protein
MYGPNSVCPICSGQIKQPKDSREQSGITPTTPSHVVAELASIFVPPAERDPQPESEESPLFSKNYKYIILAVLVIVLVSIIYYRHLPGFRIDETRSDAYVGRWKEQVPIEGDMDNLVDSQNTLVVTRRNADYLIIRNEMDKGKTDVWHGKVSSKGMLYAIGNSSNVGDLEISLEKNNRLKMVIYENDDETINILYRKMLGH